MGDFMEKSTSVLGGGPNKEVGTCRNTPVKRGKKMATNENAAGGTKAHTLMQMILLGTKWGENWREPFGNALRRRGPGT